MGEQCLYVLEDSDLIHYTPVTTSEKAWTLEICFVLNQVFVSICLMIVTTLAKKKKYGFFFTYVENNLEYCFAAKENVSIGINILKECERPSLSSAHF
jgi:hypothetical protein